MVCMAGTNLVSFYGVVRLSNPPVGMCIGCMAIPFHRVWWTPIPHRRFPACFFPNPCWSEPGFRRTRTPFISLSKGNVSKVKRRGTWDRIGWISSPIHPPVWIAISVLSHRYLSSWIAISRAPHRDFLFPPFANEPGIVSTTQKRGNPPTQPTMAKEKLSDGSAGEPDASMAKQRGAKEEERKAWKRFVESDKWKKMDNETEWVHQPIPLEQVRETWPNRTLAVHGWTVEDAKRNLPYLDEDLHAPLPAVAHFQKVKIEDFEVRRE